MVSGTIWILWGYPRLVEASREDPLEQPPDQLRCATEVKAALLLATVHEWLGQKETASRWHQKALEWMNKNEKDAGKVRDLLQMMPAPQEKKAP